MWKFHLLKKKNSSHGVKKKKKRFPPYMYKKMLHFLKSPPHPHHFSNGPSLRGSSRVLVVQERVTNSQERLRLRRSWGRVYFRKPTGTRGSFPLPISGFVSVKVRFVWCKLINGCVPFTLSSALCLWNMCNLFRRKFSIFLWPKVSMTSIIPLQI